MEEIEPFPIKPHKKLKYWLRFKVADIYPNDKSDQTFALFWAGLFSSLLALFVVMYVTEQEPTYRDRLEHAGYAFDDCIDTTLNLNQQQELRLSQAFPDYILDSSIVQLVEDCHEQNPMPEK